MQLMEKHCEPCEDTEDPMTAEEADRMLANVPDWERESHKIHRTLHFDDFKQTMAFVNKVADVAEQEGHHPDMEVGYGKVKIVLWTHNIGGLSENDFIMAAKIDRLE